MLPRDAKIIFLGLGRVNCSLSTLWVKFHHGHFTSSLTVFFFKFWFYHVIHVLPGTFKTFIKNVFFMWLLVLFLNQNLLIHSNHMHITTSILNKSTQFHTKISKKTCFLPLNYDVYNISLCWKMFHYSVVHQNLHLFDTPSPPQFFLLLFLLNLQ